MKPSLATAKLLAIAAAMAALSGCAMKVGSTEFAAPREVAGTTCQTPPVLHCPDADCPGTMVVEQGPAVEPATGRNFFLDYPCDLKRNEKVTFILSLHGAGSYGNWQRHYFPIVDYVNKYRLVVATPNSPTRIWSSGDDEYLQNIVNLVYGQFGEQNIRAFWLVGHSQGGMTSNRLVRTDFFQQRVDGWLSLSGGRLGPTPPIPASYFAGAAGGRGGAGTAAGRGGAAAGADAAGRGAAGGAVGRGGAAAGGPPAGIPGAAALRELPPGNFSFIFETGEHELGDQPIPAESPWATRLGCKGRVEEAKVVDTRPGYVYDSTRQDPGSDAWGRLPRPGTAEVFEYPSCGGGRIVADVVRVGKGHTEGLEPQVTEKLIQLMLSAKS